MAFVMLALLPTKSPNIFEQMRVSDMPRAFLAGFDKKRL